MISPLRSNLVSESNATWSFSRTGPAMKVNGYVASRSDKVKAFRSGRTAPCTRATGPTIRLMVRVD